MDYSFAVGNLILNFFRLDIAVIAESSKLKGPKGRIENQTLGGDFH